MRTSAITTLLSITILCSCGHTRDTLDITVENTLTSMRTNEIVELPADSLLGLLGSQYCYITDNNGRVIPSQITHDGKLIFPANVEAEASAIYTVHPSDTLPVYDAVATGRIYPERADDIAWENEFIGFRAYGPTTQQRGEKAYGYDIFFKHPTPEPILERLYEPETNPLTWQKRDSLLNISQELADSFVNTISYHIDHGLGMDCYAVGPTLGAGVAAIIDNDTICYPWCYQEAEVLDNGPLRFTVKMRFAPVSIGEDSNVTETRIITLDAASHLNRCDISFAGLSDNRKLAAGFPLRDNSTPYTDSSRGIIAYADPTQGPDNGKAMLGLILPSACDTATIDNHVLGITSVNPDSTYTYYWGFAWDRADITDMNAWNSYLTSRHEALTAPLHITVK